MRRHTVQFVCDVKHVSMVHCNSYRKNRVIAEKINKVYYILNIDRDDGRSLTGILQNAFYIQKQNPNLSKNLKVENEGLIWSRVLCNTWIFDEYADNRSRMTSESQTFTEKTLPERLHHLDGCIYCKHYKTTTRSHLVCLQRLKESIVTSSKRQRICERIKKENWNGSLSFSYRDHPITIRLRHDAQHMSKRKSSSLAEPQRLRIEKLIHTGLSPFQIVTYLRGEGSELIQYADVCNHWLSCILQSFRKSTDPLLSAKLYAEKLNNIGFLHFQVLLFALGVYRKVGADVLDKYRVEEI